MKKNIKKIAQTEIVAAILKNKLLQNIESKIILVNDKNVRMIINLFNETLCDLLSRKDLGSIQLKGFFKITKRFKKPYYSPHLQDPNKEIYHKGQNYITIKSGNHLRNSVK